jgi:predicted O-methyltransferase YrrM
VLHAADLWRRWSKLTEIVGGARVGQRSPAAVQRAFIGAMNASAATQADHIVSLVAPGPAHNLLDVGGASGTYTLAFLRAVPDMRATLFDRPAVVEMARERLGAAGVLDRVTLVPGDFYQDPLPPGHDLAFVSAIIHQNSPEQNVELFRKVLAALGPGGRIVVRDYVLSPDRTSPKSGAIFAVNMLTGGAGGNCYTYEEIKDALSQAGFTRVNLMQPGTHMDGLVEALKR